MTKEEMHATYGPKLVTPLPGPRAILAGPIRARGPGVGDVGLYSLQRGRSSEFSEFLR